MEAQLAGRLTVALDGNWGGGSDWGDSLLEGQVDVADLLVVAPALGPDRLELNKLQAPCRIVGKDGQIEIEQLLLDCDLGKLQVAGTVSTKDMTASNVAAALMKEPCQITGRLDLVRWRRCFPMPFAAIGNRNHGRRIECHADQPTGRRRQQLDRHARH